MLRKLTGAHVAVAHHLNKNGAVRGTSAIYGDFDTAVELKNGYITSPKLKGAKDGPVPYDLPKHILGTDEDGEVVTQVAMRTGVRRQAKVKVDPNTQPGKALTVLEELCAAQGEVADDFPGMPPDMRLVHKKAWRDSCRDRLTDGNADAKRVAFDRAVRSLVEVGSVLEHPGEYFSLPSGT